VAPISPVGPDLLRMRAAIPAVIAWIDEYLNCHARAAVSVYSLHVPGLAAVYSKSLLCSTRAVAVDRVEFPPVEQFGLPELRALQTQDFHGITFKDTYFLHKDVWTRPSIHFHELVHVVQWARLGPERFLLAYGQGLAQFGYANSPLEQVAYQLQHRFELGRVGGSLVPFINSQCDLLWSSMQKQ
jgi:hypothetical protein